MSCSVKGLEKQWFLESQGSECHAFGHAHKDGGTSKPHPNRSFQRTSEGTYTPLVQTSLIFLFKKKFELSVS